MDNIRNPALLEASPTADIRSTAARRPANNRAKISNGTKMVVGLDGRSATARRYRDLEITYADDCGGEASLTEAQRTLIAQTATLQVQAERVQAAVLRGETSIANN